MTKKIIATLNDIEIYNSDIPTYLGQLENEKGEITTYNVLSEEHKKNVISQIIQKKHLLKEATNKNINKKDEIIENTTLYKNNMTIDALILDNLESYKKSITSEEIDKKYKEIGNAIKGQKLIRLFNITLQNKEQAEEAIGRINSNKNPGLQFSEIAKLYSVDSETAQNGGDLGFILESDLKPGLKEVVPQLEVGKIIGPIKIDNLFHIIMAEQINEAKQDPLEKVKNTIIDIIAREKLDKYLISIVNEEKFKEIKLS